MGNGMNITVLETKLAPFGARHPEARAVVTNGSNDVYDGPFDWAAIAKVLNPRENVICLYARTAFFVLHVKKGEVVDCWRSPNGDWIGAELGLEGRNVFGDLPVSTPQPASPPVPQPTPSVLAQAARTGNLAAAINGV